MFENEIPKYKKKSNNLSPKKSDHKHEFSDCIYEYNNPSGMFSKEKGFCSKVEIFGGTYCPICGRIGKIFRSVFYTDTTNLIWWDKIECGRYFKYELSEQAKKEINPETRTLPTFYLEDLWTQKYVELKNEVK